MDDFFPEPQVAPGLDVRVARINEKEGVIEKVIIIDDAYDALSNDRYIVATAVIPVSLPKVNAGKLITVKNTSAGDVTVNGYFYNIDGFSSSTVAATKAITFLFNGTEWNEL